MRTVTPVARTAKTNGEEKREGLYLRFRTLEAMRGRKENAFPEGQWQWCARLEASSYERALQGEPIGRVLHFTGHEIVSAQLPLERNLPAAGFEQLRE